MIAPSCGEKVAQSCSPDEEKTGYSMMLNPPLPNSGKYCFPPYFPPSVFHPLYFHSNQTQCKRNATIWSPSLHLVSQILIILITKGAQLYLEVSIELDFC